MEVYTDETLEYWVNLAENSEAFDENYDLLTEYTDGEARAGYGCLTGKEARTYTPRMYARKDIPFWSTYHHNGKSAWSDSEIEKAYKDPKLERFWYKVDKGSAAKRYNELLKQLVSIERWLRWREKYYTEDQLWEHRGYHQALAKMRDVRQEINMLWEEYDIPVIDLNMLIEELL